MESSKARCDIYDMGSNSWKRTADTNYPKYGTSLVTVGSRVIALPGTDSAGVVMNYVEEFIYETKTWTVLNPKLKQARSGYAALSVPAMMFKDMPGGCVGSA